MADTQSHQTFLDAFASLTVGEPEILESVSELVLDECLDTLTLDFTTKRLVLQANGEDDTIQVSVEPLSEARRAGLRTLEYENPWRNLLGKPFGWGWITTNQQGYCDGVMLSFQLLEPMVVINVMASTLLIRWLAAANVCHDRNPQAAELAPLLPAQRAQPAQAAP